MGFSSSRVVFQPFFGPMVFFGESRKDCDPDIVLVFKPNRIPNGFNLRIFQARFGFFDNRSTTNIFVHQKFGNIEEWEK